MEKDKEIKYHHIFLTWLDDANIKYDSWGAAGPDVLFEDFDIIGEFKIEENKTSYKNAFKEIQSRKNPKFNIKNFKHFFILTKKYIRIYETNTIDWDNQNFNNYISNFDYIKESKTVFLNNEKDKNKFLEYIQANCNKISVDAHMSDVLDLLLSDELDISIMDAIIIITKLNENPIFLKNKIIYNPSEDNEYEIVFKSKEVLDTVKKRLINKYYIKNINNVKEYIKFNYSSHLSDQKKSNLGKYYTPKSVVKLVKDQIQLFLNNDTYVMDLACGCGAFMEIFDDCHIYGRDIDENAIGVLEILGIKNVDTDNSLVNVCREKYNISNDADLIIVGNPPYNDTTSKNKRFGTNAKTVTDIEIDADIYSKDLGQSFLKAYAKLNPNYICVLHPLSYLIKPNNFKSLKNFTNNYKLIKGTLFSSTEFPDLRNNTPFPIVIALYEKGSMDYNYIQNFKFDILNEKESFTLSKFQTIDEIINGKKYINKYPKIYRDQNNIKKIEKSDINLYQYNFRDTNSIKSSGNLMYLANNNNLNYCTVNFCDLYKYSYINMYKLFFENNYLIGNLSAIIDINEYENNKDLQNLMIIGTILKNCKRIKCFDYQDKNSLLYTKFLINDFKKAAKNYTNTPNFYNIFIDIVNGNVEEEESIIIYQLIKDYFNKLKNRYLNQ